MWARETQEDLTAAQFAITVQQTKAVDYEKLMTQLHRRMRDVEDAMGSIVYSDSQKEDLLERLNTTRVSLMEVHQQEEPDEASSDDFSIPLPSLPKNAGPKLYVRDDGTVDWDGALQDKEALQKFGSAVWARINGRDPDQEDGHGEDRPKVKIMDTPAIEAARTKLDTLSSQLSQLETSHIALLNSVMVQGQAVANVNLAQLAPDERFRIRESVASMDRLKEQVSFQTLLYELERIYAYFLGELPAAKGYVPLPDRLNVAEFGLLEAQIEGFRQQIERGEALDTDVLAVVMEQLTDFKRRLGIDYYIAGLSFDGEAIRRWLAELMEKTKSGLAFYVKGVRLFWNDILFCASLIGKAAQGYTLKPREVRTIRCV